MNKTAQRKNTVYKVNCNKYKNSPPQKWHEPKAHRNFKKIFFLNKAVMMTSVGNGDQNYMTIPNPYLKVEKSEA